MHNLIGMPLSDVKKLLDESGTKYSVNLIKDRKMTEFDSELVVRVTNDEDGVCLITANFLLNAFKEAKNENT